jgi:hypothetical protein
MIKVQMPKNPDDWGEIEWSAILAGAYLEFVHRGQVLLSSGQPIEAKYKAVTNDICALCGACYYLCGFDFMIGYNTVCEDCVGQHATELLAKWPWETRIVKAERAYPESPDEDRPIFPWTDYAKMLLALENLKSIKQLNATNE